VGGRWGRFSGFGEYSPVQDGEVIPGRRFAREGGCPSWELVERDTILFRNVRILIAKDSLPIKLLIGFWGLFICLFGFLAANQGIEAIRMQQFDLSWRLREGVHLGPAVLGGPAKDDVEQYRLCRKWRTIPG
jgi:hypothetical protein